MQAICAWWKLNVTLRPEVTHIEWLAQQFGLPIQLAQFPSSQAAFSYLLDAARVAGHWHVSHLYNLFNMVALITDMLTISGSHNL